jgi:hypothetical protein
MSNYWYEKGREFAEIVEIGPGAGAFNPNSAMAEWHEFVRSCDLPPYEGLTDEQAKDLTGLLEAALSVRRFREEFASGYRAALRASRSARRAAAHV